ncbi:endospore germination permease [Tissierella praeacuta]|uniref:GerAB/ArcD/ProY family transporter n=1 Tax=Tissierella praeacuta TaxID=43131 RepID=UPI0033409172
MSEKISSRQAILFITISRVTTILTTMPIIYMPPANQDIWMVIIVAFFYTTLVCTPLLFLSNRFNEFTIIEYTEKILGKVFGKVVGALYGIFFLTVAILFSYIAIQMVRTSFLTNTKPILTIIFLMGCCMYVASKGVDVILRGSELLVPIILVFIIIFVVLGYSSIDLKILLPIYKDSSFLDINIGAIQMSFIFVDIFIISMIAPKLENKKDINKIFIKAVFCSSLFILLVVVATQASLGIEQTKHSNFPFLSYIRRMKTYSIFERVESVYILIWIVAMMGKIVMYTYIATETFKEVFNKKDRNFILYIIGTFIILITYYFAEYRPILIEIKSIPLLEYIYYFIFETFIPLVLVIVYIFRRKKFKTGETE